jgi:hypothetical protein
MAVDHAAAMDTARLREVSVMAHCDPRSVRAHLAGEPLRASVARRIEIALRELEDAVEAAPARRRSIPKRSRTR